MSQDTLLLCGQINSDSGQFTTNGAGALTITATGQAITATSGQTSLQNVVTQNISTAQQTGTVTTLSTGNTITIGTSGGNGVLRVTAAAAVTGIILSAGTRAGQVVTVVHEGAAGNTITFAASGTSNVADGASDVITGPSARSFVWDSVTSLWYALH